MSPTNAQTNKAPLPFVPFLTQQGRRSDLPPPRQHSLVNQHGRRVITIIIIITVIISIVNKNKIIKNNKLKKKDVWPSPAQDTTNFLLLYFLLWFAQTHRTISSFTLSFLLSVPFDQKIASSGRPPLAVCFLERKKPIRKQRERLYKRLPTACTRAPRCLLVHLRRKRQCCAALPRSACFNFGGSTVPVHSLTTIIVHQ